MRSVIWDMGGTLVDTYPEVDRALAAAVWGGEPTAPELREVRDLRVRSIEHSIDVLARRHGVAEERLRGAYAALMRRWSTHPAPLMDGAREVLDAVHAAGALNLVATHRDRASAGALLRALGVDVDDLVCAPDGWARKPDPQMFRVLLDRHHLAPADVVSVGDRLIDVRAADACGLEAVLLVPAGTEAPDLAGLHPRVIPRLRDLLALLG